MPGKAVEAKPAEVELLPSGAVPVSALRDALTNHTKLRVVLDDSDIAAAMLERKLSAETMEDMDSSGELDDIESIYSAPVRVIGVGFRNSDEQYLKGEGSLGIFAVLNLVTTQGETLTVGSGATDVVVTASKILEKDWLGKGWWVIAPASKETRAGFRPINMTPAKVTETQSGVPF